MTLRGPELDFRQVGGQVVLSGVRHAGADEGSSGGRRRVGRQRQIDLAVNLGRLAFVAAHQEVLRLVRRPLDEHAEALSAHRPQLLLGDLALNPQQLAAARIDLFLRDALRQECRDRALFARKIEHADMVQLGLAHEVAQALKGRVGLAGVSRDERGAKSPVRHARPEARHQIAYLALAVPTAHRLEHAGIDVLDWHVEVAGDAGLAADGVELAQQRRQPWRLGMVSTRKVGAARRESLRDQAYLFGPARDEIPRLAQDRLGRAAALRAAELGDDAERAGAIAPLRDLDVRGVHRLRAAAGRRVVVEIRRCVDDAQTIDRSGDRLGDGADLVGADELIDFGHLGRQLFRVALRQTAGDHQSLAAPRLLVLGHLEDGIDRLLFGLADEAAGVDDDDLGGLWRRNQLVSRVGRVPEHDLGVDAIFGAA